MIIRGKEVRKKELGVESLAIYKKLLAVKVTSSESVKLFTESYQSAVFAVEFSGTAVSNRTEIEVNTDYGFKSTD